jgi:hypothetical protein
MKWREQLAELVVEESIRERQSPVTFWLVFDRVGAAKEKPGAGSFLARLAEEVEKHATHPRAPRLVLIESPGELTQRRRSHEEQIAYVTSTDIRAFFLARGVPEARVDELTGEVSKAMGESALAYPLEIMAAKIEELLAKEGAPNGK